MQQTFQIEFYILYISRCEIWPYIYITNKLHHRKCFVRIFIYESQNFRNSLFHYAHSFVSKVLRLVNKNPYKALSMK